MSHRYAIIITEPDGSKFAYFDEGYACPEDAKKAQRERLFILGWSPPLWWQWWRWLDTPRRWPA